MPHRKGGENMRIIYSKPSLKNLSQGERISYIRQLRMMSQDEVSDKLGLTGECKRRTMTRYERGDRNPKQYRLKELSNILQVNINSIKQYDFKDPTDIFYLFMWMEELYPNFGFKMNLQGEDRINNAFLIWNNMKIKRNNNEITYEEYIEWKLNFEISSE